MIQLRHISKQASPRRDPVPAYQYDGKRLPSPDSDMQILSIYIKPYSHTVPHYTIPVLSLDDAIRRSALPEHGPYIAHQRLGLLVCREVASARVTRLEDDIAKGAQPTVVGDGISTYTMNGRHREHCRH